MRVGKSRKKASGSRVVAHPSFRQHEAHQLAHTVADGIQRRVQATFCGADRLRFNGPPDGVALIVRQSAVLYIPNSSQKTVLKILTRLQRAKRLQHVLNEEAIRPQCLLLLKAIPDYNDDPVAPPYIIHP